MTKEEIQVFLNRAFKEAHYWEIEAECAEDAQRAAEEMCQEWYDKIDYLQTQLEAHDKT